MDKLISSSWFMKIGAFLIALFLFFSVNSNPINNSSNPYNTPSSTETATIKNVPVEVYYDTDNLIVSGIPETLDITIEGPKSIVITAKSTMDFEIYVDLSDPKIGSQKVPIKVKNLSDKINYTLTQANATAVVEEKVTENFKVEAEFDKTLLAEGYSSDPPYLSPTEVEITGAKSHVDKVSVVKATVKTDSHVTNDILTEATVQAFDSNMNLLDVNIEPSTVDISINVNSPSKEVSLSAKATGAPPEGVKIESIKIDSETATIYGGESILKDIKEITVPVDVSNIDEDTVIEIPVSLPDGVVGSSIDTVKVTIKIKKENTQTISNIPIEIKGLDNEKYEAEILNPSKGMVDLAIEGEASKIKSLKSSDFDIFIEVKELNVGNHTVPLKVNAPDEVHWELPNNSKTITVEISEKSSDG
ncbi:YbbR-like domain-containing protein [Pradoshia sp. D12]|uniref:CdaR family protein n=1 Tax=Bacillaceae TaxID=186817 RepID=UPI00080AC47A|nr:MULTISPECIES: CdaR family protein [Bacillaceae]OCA89258.1 hypothetical protein A8L44_17025 [Bacillus sp. FJAT-27986]QFK69940.1 YbbR-like domain-containing protein [Pradoshia sp. D12]TPF70562.1 YbbR-like domain-containing protein [Bacillus sp. D12]